MLRDYSVIVIDHFDFFSLMMQLLFFVDITNPSPIPL